jgi:pre-mRNA-processing factor 19
VIATAVGRTKIFEGQEEVAVFSAHAGEVSGLALHPSGDVVASVGIDKSYVLYDLTTSTVVTQVYSNSGMFLKKPHLLMVLKVYASIHLRSISP